MISVFAQGAKPEHGAPSYAHGVVADIMQAVVKSEEQHKKLEDIMQPETHTDIEELQSKLREAIAERDKRKQKV